MITKKRTYPQLFVTCNGQPIRGKTFEVITNLTTRNNWWPIIFVTRVRAKNTGPKINNS